MKKPLDFIPWVAGALLALTAWQVLFRADFTITRELSLVDIATALLTLFLAFYIPSRLERRLSSQRFELDILIRGAERLQAEFATVRRIVITTSGALTPEQTTSIVQSFNDITHSLHTLTELSTLCKRPDLSPLLDLLQKRRFSFKRLVTGANFQNDPNFFYTPDQVALIGQQYFEADLDISRLIVHINSVP